MIATTTKHSHPGFALPKDGGALTEETRVFNNAEPLFAKLSKKA